MLVLVALPFVYEVISANTLGVSFPAPSSVELQYQPSKCVPPMIEKEELEELFMEYLGYYYDLDKLKSIEYSYMSV